MNTFRFTEKGMKDLRNKLDNMVQLYSNLDQKYPATFRMLGFPHLELDSREELKYRINELCQILGLKIEKESDE